MFPTVNLQYCKRNLVCGHGGAVRGAADMRRLDPKREGKSIQKKCSVTLYDLYSFIQILFE